MFNNKYISITVFQYKDRPQMKIILIKINNKLIVNVDY